MNKGGLILLCLFWVFRPRGQAAESTSAGARAYLYQREARTVLTERHWRITQDENGKLSATHGLGPLGAGGGGNQMIGLSDSPALANAFFRGVAVLTLTFTPADLTRTKCAANIVAYFFWNKMSQAERDHVKPRPFNNPDTTREIQGIMAKAEKGLVAKHPEYGTH